MNTNRDFFDRIKALVKDQNTTIDSFLQATFSDGSVSRSVYNGWRRRENLPRADYAFQIAHALGVSVEYLVTGIEPKYAGMSEIREKLHHWIDILSEDELQDLDRYLDLLESGAIVTSLRNKKTGE